MRTRYHTGVGRETNIGEDVFKLRAPMVKEKSEKFWFCLAHVELNAVPDETNARTGNMFLLGESQQIVYRRWALAFTNTMCCFRESARHLIQRHYCIEKHSRVLHSFYSKTRPALRSAPLAVVSIL